MYSQANIRNLLAADMTSRKQKTAFTFRKTQMAQVAEMFDRGRQ